MNKAEARAVVQELREDRSYPDVEDTPLHGIGLLDFECAKHVRKEAIVQFLRWQTICLDGTIDETELTECLYLLKKKRIIMV